MRTSIHAPTDIASFAPAVPAGSMKPGYYDVRPTVTFEAAYRFDGSGWTTVGELDVAAAPTRVRVVTVETRLTRGSCLDYPDDPGCR
ncbi:hypothetical protein [Agromyces aerolatus]|uniref:hypothetical protein n=1 Tax=Agromyces sp. LY-1074 TaxID=3074080 RepID=UPI00285F6ACE|nr:hypothetical protein [Agromyces sp. LY-1074]MDR5700730.1 hypothetical protein [Agromyces sp. LY-1074]